MEKISMGESIEKETKALSKILRALEKIESGSVDFTLAYFLSYKESIYDYFREFGIDGFVSGCDLEEAEDQIKVCREFANELELFMKRRVEKQEKEDKEDIKNLHKCGIIGCENYGTEVIVASGSENYKIKYLYCEYHFDSNSIFKHDPNKIVRKLKRHDLSDRVNNSKF